MSAKLTHGLKVHIRWMIRRDMTEALAIEADSFEFPWCENDFLRCLRQRNCIGMVAEHNDRIVGFTMLGAEAGEVMAAVQMAMLAKAPYPMVRDAVIAHLTFAEGLGPLLSNVGERVPG